MSRKYNIPKICVSATLLVVGITSVLQAQQVPLYQQYFYNRFVYNPAYAGYDNASNVYLIHRAQWSEMPGQPTTTAITLDGPLKSKKIGLGVSLYSDRTDITSRVGAYGSFAYNIGIGKDQNLMFGISMGGLENRIDFSQIIAKDLDDPAILASMERKKGLDGTFGIGYRWKELHFGVAIPQILASSFEFSDANGGGSRAHYNLSRHYMTSLEYKFFVNPDKDVALTPMFLVRYMPEAPMQFDANLIFNWRETAFLAISYRSDYAIGVNARIKLKEKISIGYTYDVISSSINAYSGISHEIMLGYTFGGTSIVDESELEELQERIDSLADELAANQEAINERYNELISEADRLFEEGKFLEAKTAYEKALALKPDEQYPKDKLAEIEGAMNAKYEEAISKADVLFNSGDFEGAKRAYEEALKYKPGDEYAMDKIAEIESTNTTQYEDAISRGDALFKAKDYEGAKRAYEEALRHKPRDAYARDKIRKTSRIIELFNKRYDALIQTADSLFMAKQFKLAKDKYLKASQFKPNARYPKDMISMITNNKTGGDVRMVKSADFLDEFGNVASKGFYVVMASFKSKSNADRMKARKGYKSVFNKVRGFHYVYMTRLETYDGAKAELLNKARVEKPDSWIYILR